MTIPFIPNVTASIYRTATPGSPYTLGAAGPANVKGYLQPRLQTGRHGTALYLKWTHILYLDQTIDVRDAYNSQLDPARDNTKADTVIIKSTDNTKQTAFYVVYVELALKGTAVVHQRVYLDRFLPQAWPTDAL